MPLCPMFTDSHCHLTFPELSAQINEIRLRMHAASVSRAMCICTTLEEFEDVYALSAQYADFWCSVGVHPDNEGVVEPSVEGLVALAQRPKVLAIGETGLDYYRLNGRSIADMEWQRNRFRVHIKAAQRVHKPLVVHTRSASDDTLAILKEEGEGAPGADRAGGVFHCFTESLDVARQALDLGYFISFSGIITFNSAKSLREVVKYVPLDRMLIETDSPYLAPVPHRGITNDPSLVPHVAAQIAALKEISVEDVARITSSNFDVLFLRPSSVAQ